MNTKQLTFLYTYAGWDIIPIHLHIFRNIQQYIYVDALPNNHYYAEQCHGYKYSKDYETFYSTVSSRVKGVGGEHTETVDNCWIFSLPMNRKLYYFFNQDCKKLNLNKYYLKIIKESQVCVKLKCSPCDDNLKYYCDPEMLVGNSDYPLVIPDSCCCCCFEDDHSCMFEMDSCHHLLCSQCHTDLGLYNYDFYICPLCGGETSVFFDEYEDDDENEYEDEDEDEDDDENENENEDQNENTYSPKPSCCHLINL